MRISSLILQVACLASMASAAPVKKPVDILCSRGDISCAGMVERATAPRTNMKPVDILCSRGEVSCAGMVER